MKTKLGPEPANELIRFGDLTRWLRTYTRAQLRKLIDAGIIVGERHDEKEHFWFRKSQVKEALKL